jgi:hypothetical protein
MRRVLVCGGRGYSNRAHLFGFLDGLHAHRQVSVVISGRCPTGADFLGEEWAQARGIEVSPFPAPWSDITAPGARVKTRRDGTQYNALAGFWRNQRMIDEGKPWVVVAFPGGSGTADMVRRARAANVPVIFPCA